MNLDANICERLNLLANILKVRNKIEQNQKCNNSPLKEFRDETNILSAYLFKTGSYK